MSASIDRLLRLRTDIETQVEELASGRIKVLLLLGGGSWDEDCSREQQAVLQSYLVEIDAILAEQSSALLSGRDDRQIGSAGGRKPIVAPNVATHVAQDRSRQQ